MKNKAFLFDLNGTMIDDMRYHQKVWHRMVNDILGGNLSEEEVKHQMYGKNQELLIRVFGEGKFTEEEIQRISIQKEELYQKMYKPEMELLPGLPEFLETAKKLNILMAIGSAAIPFNINFVIDNLDIRHYFSAIVSAEDVEKSKPDPETYLKCARLLNVDPSDCIVFEDAPKGVEAALNAGMKSVVLTTMHTKEEFSRYPNVLVFVEDYIKLEISDSGEIIY